MHARRQDSRSQNLCSMLRPLFYAPAEFRLTPRAIEHLSLQLATGGIDVVSAGTPHHQNVVAFCAAVGAPSVVPGRAEMLFQFRETDPAILAALDGALDELVAEANKGPCRVTIAARGQSVPRWSVR